jgi:hypothetical protein
MHSKLCEKRVKEERRLQISRTQYAFTCHAAVWCCRDGRWIDDAWARSLTGRRSMMVEIRPVSMGFHDCFMHIKYSATSSKFHFLYETLRREKERVSPWWNLWAQFHMRWKLCETHIETQIEFHHATMQLNHTMRERLWDP